MKYKKIVFFNMGGKGDIHSSRSFIDFLVKTLPRAEFHYTHIYEPLLNIPRLSEGRDSFYNDSLGAYRHHQQRLTYLLATSQQLKVVKDTIYINTWYNSKPTNEDSVKSKLGKDFRNPLPTCCFRTLYFNFCRIFEELGIDIRDYDPSLFFPAIRHDPSYVVRIDEFLKTVANAPRKVLICNNAALSGQSNNSSLLPAVISLSKDFPNCDFFITNERAEGHANIHSLGGGPYDDCNKIAYIASQCDIIAGRQSGPHTFCMTRDVYSDPTKTVIFVGSWERNPGEFLGWHDFGIDAQCKISQVNDELFGLLLAKTL